MVGEMGGWAALVLSVLLGVWLYLQSRRLERVERQLRALMRGSPGTDRMSLGDLVARQAERMETVGIETEKLRQEVRALDAQMARSVQHVGLVRYNPFEEAGGDQSFALALLDRLGNGVVMNSLH